MGSNFRFGGLQRRVGIWSKQYACGYSLDLSKFTWLTTCQWPCSWRKTRTSSTIVLLLKRIHLLLRNSIPTNLLFSNSMLTTGVSIYRLSTGVQTSSSSFFTSSGCLSSSSSTWRCTQDATRGSWSISNLKMCLTLWFYLSTCLGWSFTWESTGMILSLSSVPTAMMPFGFTISIWMQISTKMFFSSL